MENKTTYARICTITGEGMNEGYCINDGEIYIKYESHLIQYLRDIDNECAHLTNTEILDYYYNNEYYYYTEWE
jgi:hypothetical protein